MDRTFFRSCGRLLLQGKIQFGSKWIVLWKTSTSHTQSAENSITISHKTLKSSNQKLFHPIFLTQTANMLRTYSHKILLLIRKVMSINFTRSMWLNSNQIQSEKYRDACSEHESSRKTWLSLTLHISHSYFMIGTWIDIRVYVTVMKEFLFIPLYEFILSNFLSFSLGHSSKLHSKESFFAFSSSFFFVKH